MHVAVYQLICEATAKIDAKTSGLNGMLALRTLDQFGELETTSELATWIEINCRHARFDAIGERLMKTDRRGLDWFRVRDMIKAYIASKQWSALRELSSWLLGLVVLLTGVVGFWIIVAIHVVGSLVTGEEVLIQSGLPALPLHLVLKELEIVMVIALVS